MTTKVRYKIKIDNIVSGLMNIPAMPTPTTRAGVPRS